MEGRGKQRLKSLSFWSGWWQVLWPKKYDDGTPKAARTRRLTVVVHPFGSSKVVVPEKASKGGL